MTKHETSVHSPGCTRTCTPECERSSLFPNFCAFAFVELTVFVHGYVFVTSFGDCGGCGLSLQPCKTPRVPVFLIQLARELGSQSKEENVGECLPEGFCCSIHDNFCII